MKRYPSGVSERIKIAESFGYALIRMKKHLVFKNSDGHIVVCSKSPSHRGSKKDFISDLRRGVKMKKVS
jgi:hypothetical protein